MIQRSTPKRPRDTFESDQSPPPKRSKPGQSSATISSETTVGYDPCPVPSVADYFYPDLVPKAPQLSQLFPTLCRDVHVIHRWLGSVGCAIYWRMVMEKIDETTAPLDPSRHLVGFIARSLAKLHGPQKDTSSPKFHTFCETLRSHRGLDDASRTLVFSKFR